MCHTRCVCVLYRISSVQSLSYTTLCNPMNCSMPGLPVHHQLPEFTQTQRPSSQWCHPAISSSVVPLVAEFIDSIFWNIEGKWEKMVGSGWILKHSFNWISAAQLIGNLFKICRYQLCIMTDCGWWSIH